MAATAKIETLALDLHWFSTKLLNLSKGMKLKLSLITATVTFCIAPLAAQPPARPLTFDDALSRSLTQNPALAAARYEERALEHERKAAFGLRLPQVGVMGAYIRMSDDIGIDLNGLKEPAGDILGLVAGSGLPIPPAVLQQASALLGRDWGYTIQDRDFGFVGGSVTLPIYTGGKINAANRAARINEQAAAEKGLQTRNSLMSELVERYYGLNLAIQSVRVREQVCAAMQAHLRDARAMEESGMIARSERLYMEVKAAEAERDLLAARLQEKTLRDALGNTLGDGQDYTPVSQMFVLRALPAADYFKDAARQHNPQLRQVGLTRNLAEEGVKAKRAEFLPQVAAMGGMSFYNYQVASQMPKWFIGAGVKITIFDGLSREHKYNAARYTVRRVEALEDKAGNDISTLIGKLYNEMGNYLDRLPSIDAALEFATEYLRVQGIAFREGVASATDVTDAELNLAATRINRLQTAYYYDLMLARLLEAAGMSELFAGYARSADAEYIGFE